MTFALAALLTVATPQAQGAESLRPVTDKRGAIVNSKQIKKINRKVDALLEPEPQPVIISPPEPEPPVPPQPQGDIQGVICSVFDDYCSQALSVVACESGFNTAAINGQYLGLFQMGEWERANYGHGSDALSQSQAAFAYFAATGYDWSPWACKP